MQVCSTDFATATINLWVFRLQLLGTHWPTYAYSLTIIFVTICVLSPSGTYNYLLTYILRLLTTKSLSYSIILSTNISMWPTFIIYLPLSDHVSKSHILHNLFQNILSFLSILYIHSVRSWFRAVCTSTVHWLFCSYDLKTIQWDQIKCHTYESTRTMLYAWL